MTDTLIEPTLDIRSFSAEDKACLNYALSFNNRTIPGGVLLAPCSTPTWVSNVGTLKGKFQVYTTSVTGQAFNPDSLVFDRFHVPNILQGVAGQERGCQSHPRCVEPQRCLHSRGGHHVFAGM